MRSLLRDLGTKVFAQNLIVLNPAGFNSSLEARSVSIDSSCSQLSVQQSRLTKHTGADVVYAPASWEISTKTIIAASRGKYNILTNPSGLEKGFNTMSGIFNIQYIQYIQFIQYIQGF